MDIAIILCQTPADIAVATGYLQAAGATVAAPEKCQDLSVHTVAGAPPNASFPSEYHKMGDFTVVTGRWP